MEDRRQNGRDEVGAKNAKHSEVKGHFKEGTVFLFVFFLEKYAHKKRQKLCILL